MHVMIVSLLVLAVTLLPTANADGAAESGSHSPGIEITISNGKVTLESHDAPLLEVVRAIGDSGTKIVMTTHDLGQARRFADEVLFLHGGRLLEAGPAEPFFAGPRTAEARAFLDGELSW